MMTKERTEIAHTVKIASTKRRPMYASMSGPGPPPAAGDGPGRSGVQFFQKKVAGREMPDVLAELDALLLGHAEGLLPLFHQLLHLRLRLLALRAAGVEPLHVVRPRAGHRSELVGEHVEGEGEEVLAAVVVPGGELLLVGGRALEGQAALDLLHLQVDADLLPLLADHLGDLRVLHELPAERHDLDPQPALAVGAQAVALRVLLREPD